jgi:hypothetical protein
VSFLHSFSSEKAENNAHDKNSTTDYQNDHPNNTRRIFNNDFIIEKDTIPFLTFAIIGAIFKALAKKLGNRFGLVKVSLKFRHS